MNRSAQVEHPLVSFVYPSEIDPDFSFISSSLQSFILIIGSCEIFQNDLEMQITFSCWKIFALPGAVINQADTEEYMRQSPI
jgi:hypothetical protein